MYTHRRYVRILGHIVGPASLIRLLRLSRTRAGQRIREFGLTVRSVRSEGYTVDSTKEILSARTILFGIINRTLFSISEPTTSCYYYKLAF